MTEDELAEIAYRTKFYCKKKGSTSLTIDNSKVKEYQITSLNDYFGVLSELESTDVSPVFSRGQFNVNYLLTPHIFRNDYDIKKEKYLINEFTRHFPYELADKSIVEKLAFMQHYRLKTRLLDISENHLVSLFFACYHDELLGNKDEKDCDGEVLFFQERDQDLKKGFQEIKHISSPTTGILIAPSFLDDVFSLGQLQIQFEQHGHFAYNSNLIKFTDIISRSVIVRVPYTNEHIKNQSGTFIICNANKLNCIRKNNQELTINKDEYTAKILDSENEELTLKSIPEYPDFKIFNGCTKWDFVFEKLPAYSKNNPTKQLQNDTFNLNRLRYKDKNEKYIAVVIPSEHKKNILNQLKKIGISENFIYHDTLYLSKFLNNI